MKTLEEFREYLVQNDKWNSILKLQMSGSLLFRVLTILAEHCDDNYFVNEFARALDEAMVIMRSDLQEYILEKDFHKSMDEFIQSLKEVTDD